VCRWPGETLPVPFPASLSYGEETPPLLSLPVKLVHPLSWYKPTTGADQPVPAKRNLLRMIIRRKFFPVKML
jgi:hypothetical protein